MKTNHRVWTLLTRVVDGTNQYLVGQRGPTCRNPGQWNLFGGNVDPEETLIRAAQREVFEETNLVLKEERLTFLFKDMVKQKPVTWFVVDLHLVPPTDMNRMKLTPEVTAYAWADNAWASRNDLHYSLVKVFEWMTVARSRSLLDTHGVLTDLKQRGLT